MQTIEEMTHEISRLYNEEGISFMDARNLVVETSGISSEYWPEIKTQLSSIHGQRGGIKSGKSRRKMRKEKEEKRGEEKKKKEEKKQLAEVYLRLTLLQAYGVTMERRDHLLSDP